MSKLTGVASMEGTPQYMAPEAALGRAEKASDIWSFGILMAQLLCGELPWKPEENFVAISFTYRLGHDASMVPSPSDSLPCDAKEIIQWCCQRDAAQRPTAAALLSNPYFQTLAPTPMKTVKKRNQERSMPRSPTRDSKQQALLKFSAFDDSAAGRSPTPLDGAEIPGLVVHGPESGALL
jgi:serine/threonine protein kinase